MRLPQVQDCNKSARVVVWRLLVIFAVEQEAKEVRLPGCVFIYVLWLNPFLKVNK
jgi:hypothetical protein